MISSLHHSTDHASSTSWIAYRVHSRGGIHVASLVVILWNLGACNPAHDQIKNTQIPPGPRITQRDQEVARVNGVPLLAEELAFQMRSGQAPRAALKALIQQELLSQEARRRGYAGSLETQHTFKRALANLYIRREFGDKVSTKSIPRAMVQQAYELNTKIYNHEEVVLLTHIVVKASPTESTAHHQKARRLINEIHHRARLKALSEAEFKQLAEDLPHDPTLSISVESLGTLKRGNTVPEFADAAFALHRTGEISPVVKTSFGYHVIYYKSRIAAVHKPLAEVEDEIRKFLFDDYRRKAFNEWAIGLEKKYATSVFWKRLESSPTPK